MLKSLDDTHTFMFAMESCSTATGVVLGKLEVQTSDFIFDTEVD